MFLICRKTSLIELVAALRHKKIQYSDIKEKGSKYTTFTLYYGQTRVSLEAKNVGNSITQFRFEHKQEFAWRNYYYIEDILHCITETELQLNQWRSMAAEILWEFVRGQYRATLHATLWRLRRLRSKPKRKLKLK